MLGYFEEEKVNYDQFWQHMVTHDQYCTKPYNWEDDYELRMKRYHEIQKTRAKIDIEKMIQKARDRFQDKLEEHDLIKDDL